MRNGVWGDCARSFYVEEGRCVQTPSVPEFQRGARTLQRLHTRVRALVGPQTTFEELFRFADAEIRDQGFENLDLLRNVGHSIESQRDARRYLAAGNSQRLGSATLFTFEPHIRAVGGMWGFKQESIYYFSPSGTAQEL